VTCSVQLSWMFVRAPMRMECTSPRITVPYQTEQSSPSTTSPMTAAFSAMNTRLPRRGSFPSYARTIMRAESSTASAPQPPRPSAPQQRPGDAERCGGQCGHGRAKAIGGNAGEQAGDAHRQRDESVVGGEDSPADRIVGLALQAVGRGQPLRAAAEVGDEDRGGA